MSERYLRIAKVLREKPLYVEATARLGCRNCRQQFARDNKRGPTPCCPGCTLRLGRELADWIVDEDELLKLETADRPPISPHAESPTPLTTGKRYVPMTPVVNTDGWQVARGHGYKGGIVELFLDDPIVAQSHADRYMRGKGPGRVLEVDLTDAIHTTATPEERYQHVEWLVFKYVEEERRLRPVLHGQPAGEDRMRSDPLALAHMALAGPKTVQPGPGVTARNQCRRCAISIVVGVFCAACARLAMLELATFVVENTPDSAAGAGRAV